MIELRAALLARRILMVLNPFTLAFSNQHLERDFRAAYGVKSLRQLRLGILTAVALYAVFGVLDRSIIPEVQETAAIIRFAVFCPLALGVLALSFRPSFVRQSQAWASILSAIAGVGIIVMIALAPPPGRYLYYAGLLLVCSSIYTFFTLRFVYALPLSWLLVAVYEMATIGGTPDIAILINNTFFLIGINIIGMSACYSMERARQSDFLDKRTIEDRTAQLDQALQATDEARQRAELLASRDPLTGLNNRRLFVSELGDGIARAAHGGPPLAMAMLDIDHFKSVNDRFGHAVGDDVLLAVARLLRDVTRDGDVLCRYGGEEFALLLRNMDLAHAGAFGERLRLAVEGLPAKSSGIPIALTMSIGVTAAASAESDSVEAVVKRADEALYRAKRNGRNRVEVATHTGASLAA